MTAYLGCVVGMCGPMVFYLGWRSFMPKRHLLALVGCDSDLYIYLEVWSDGVWDKRLSNHPKGFTVISCYINGCFDEIN